MKDRNLMFVLAFTYLVIVLVIATLEVCNIKIQPVDLKYEDLIYEKE